MVSPEWRSFASHEMVELDSHLDLTGLFIHQDSTNHLLQPAYHEVPVNENLPESPLSRPSFLHDNQGDLEGIATLHPWSRDDTAPKPKRTQNNSTNAVIHPASRVYWKGNPWYHLSWDIVGIVVSICFLILGAFVAHLKGQSQTALSIRIIQATQLAPSLWPILFSGVIGNAVRAFADWRAERGIDMLDLEQLMGSLTLAGSLVTMFRWSIFKLSSVALIVLWAFNPLGSQASLRCAYLQDQVGHGISPITYYNHNLSSQLTLTDFKMDRLTAIPRIHAIFSSVLYDITSSIQYVNHSTPAAQGIIELLGGQQAAGAQAAMDMWGNVRIPALEYLPDYNPKKPDRWLQVPWTKSTQNYASLIGDRVYGIDWGFTGNTTFNITSSYQSLNCSPWLNFTGEDWYTWLNANLMDYRDEPAFQNHPTFIVASSRYNFNNTSDRRDPKLIFGSSNTPYTWLKNFTECSTITTYVDAEVTCISRGSIGKASCGVVAIRKKLYDTEPSSMTVLNLPLFPEFTGIPFDAIKSFLGTLGAIYYSEFSASIIERYIEDPLTAFIDEEIIKLSELGSHDIKLVEKRLALLYNTLWKAGWDGRTTVTGNSANLGPQYDMLSTTSEITFPLPPVYAINTPWMTLYFISVVIMFFAAIFSLLLHQRCQGPPILGFVSSLARDSRFFDELRGNSAENGTETTKRLGKTNVMVADVKSGDEVGRIAFVPVDKGGRVSKRRWYE